jgi:phosphoserine phosphatase
MTANIECRKQPYARDVLLMENVGFPVAVNPDARLKAGGLYKSNPADPQLESRLVSTLEAEM